MHCSSRLLNSYVWSSFQISARSSVWILIWSLFSQTLEGRRSPSASKINFLLHLDDCKQVSAVGVSDALKLLCEIFTKFSLERDEIGHQDLKDWIENIILELELLDISLCRAGLAIEKTRLMVRIGCSIFPSPIKEANVLIDKRADRPETNGLFGILAILAAVFLPFSFISVSKCLRYSSISLNVIRECLG